MLKLNKLQMKLQVKKPLYLRHEISINMNKLTHLLGLMLLGILSYSCSPQLTYINDEMVKQNKWTEDDLKRIQFYLSDNITLTRQLSSGESTITGGKIKIKDGQKIEQIIFKKGTPGILLFLPKENRYAISFDNSSSDKYLVFGPNPKMNSRFALMAKEWDRYMGKVTYNGQIYETSSNSAFSALMVNLKRMHDYNKNVEIAKGVKL